ncbi:hypothetical protein B0H34DRAFT_795430 [Crassisporium funariophilum]|nr:hypothetical protein B0H34DRAFT_803344 [Crassisporium funariophilum]KAF8163771.1 hypothetical protein B0H34DRAFT_795430 [Crassisporium funariophilum]
MSGPPTSTGPPPPLSGQGSNVLDVLTRLIHDQIPSVANGMVVTREIVDRVMEIVKKNLVWLGGGFLTAGLLALLPSLLIVTINAIGFTSSGVLAGSLAAVIQSQFYGAMTSGLFASLQSFGATAVVAPPVFIGLGVASLVIGGVAVGIWAYRRHRDNAIGADKSEKKREDDDSDDNLPNKVVARRRFRGIGQQELS